MVFRLAPTAIDDGYRLDPHDSVGSTNALALQHAAAGDAGRLWVVARRQESGRGRRGRPWATPEGNLAATLLLVTDRDLKSAATLGFVAGVALDAALRQAVPGLDLRTGVDGAEGRGHRIALKWPNDVLADGAKLAGILLEAIRRQDGRQAVVIGFGVNVVAAPEGLPHPATSLRALGVEVSAAQLFGALSDAWVESYSLWDNGRGVAGVLAAWRRAAAGIGAEVAVARDGDVVRGIFETIDDAGRLIVRANDNTRIAITAGDVHFGVTATLGR